MDYAQIDLAMRAQQPDWWHAWADQQDWKDIASGVADEESVVNRIIRDKVMLAFRAAVHAGLLHE